MFRAGKSVWVLAAPTSWGEFCATYTGMGLRSLDFPRRKGRAWSDPLEVPAEVAKWHQTTCRALLEVLDGRAPQNLPPVDWTGATAFQRAVWAALMTIAPGEVRTYAGVARQIGRPQAARAVGAACAANPIPVLVPCHRVVAAGGKLGGFSGGLAWKQRLLAAEGYKNPHLRGHLC